MATIVDAARDAALEGGDYNTDYQTGNDAPATPDPTWLQQYAVGTSTPETHIVQKSANTPTDNTGDAWVPFIAQTFLAKTAATWRPA